MAMPAERTEAAAERREARSEVWFLPLAGCVAGAAAVCVALATATGAELSHDSAAYIGAARSLIEGHGLTIPFGSPQPVPFTHWPPLYPLLLALGGVVTGDVESAARWLSVALLALNALLLAILARRFTGSATLALGAELLFAWSLPMLRLHGMAMAEPPFILAMLLMVYFLDDYLSTGRWAAMGLSAAAAGLTVAARYAGIPFVAGGALIVLLGRSNARKAWTDAAVWTAAACLPGLLVAAWSRWASGAATDRALRWHPQSGDFFVRMLAGVTESFLPQALPHRNWVMAAACAVLGPIAGYSLARRAGLREKCLAALAALYVTFLLAVGFVGDAALDIRRAMEPAAPLLILLAAIAAARLLPPGRGVRIAVTAAVCAAILLPDWRGVEEWVVRSRGEGYGFGARRWRESPSLAFLRDLPAGAIVYTNLPEPVYLVTGRAARFLPAVTDATNGAGVAPAKVGEAVDAIAREARSGGVAAVYFRQDSLRLPTMIPAPELAGRCGLTRTRTFADATVYLSGND